MTLKELKTILQENREAGFALKLPSGDEAPLWMHITEVGHVTKRFIDCGGKIHARETCQLQGWTADDVEHRLSAGKVFDILQLAARVLPGDDLEVEIEYEDALISQYPVQRAHVAENKVTLILTTRHTDCLAKELCLAPSVTSCGCEPGVCC